MQEVPTGEELLAVERHHEVEVPPTFIDSRLDCLAVFGFRLCYCHAPLATWRARGDPMSHIGSSLSIISRASLRSLLLQKVHIVPSSLHVLRSKAAMPLTFKLLLERFASWQMAPPQWISIKVVGC